MKAALIVIAAAALNASPATAGHRGSARPPRDSTIAMVQRLTIRSTVLGELRELDVWVPRSYGRGASRYPTLWVLDGERNLLSAAGAAQAAADAGRMPEMIVVAVVNRNRDRDFTPPLITTPAPPEGMAGSGGAPTFLGFLKAEAIPAVESRFRAAPFRVLVGHSLGGLFATWAMSAAPDLFRAELVLDPSLWWDARASVEPARRFLTSPPDRLHRMVTVEGPGEGGWRSDWGALTGTLPEGVKATLVELSGESHGSMFHLGVYQGLLALFADWMPEMRHDASRATVAALEEQYRRLSRELGYSIEVPEAALAEARRRTSEATPEQPASPVRAEDATLVIGRWTGTNRVEPGHAIQMAMSFALVGDALFVTSTARGVAVDGGDIKSRPSSVRIENGTIRWEERRGPGVRYVHTARIDGSGKLVGTVTVVGGPPLPAGFVVPKVTFELERERPPQ